MKTDKIIYAVIGPTASGKSAYAVGLAEKIGGEVISGDSMQIYRGMDIGTAKPTLSEMRGIKHHLIDVADITEPYSAIRFVESASSAIEDIFSRGKVPIIAGGTGMYIEMLISGVRPPANESDPELREELYRYARENGADALHKRLAEADPEAAAAIHPNNVKRVVRALEICYLSGMTKTESDAASRENAPEYEVRTVMLAPKDRSELYARIESRVDSMFELGLAREVESLCKRGLRTTPTASQAIGYKEFYPFFDGECDLSAVREAVKINTRHYAKRQLTWFARMHKDETILI